MKTITPFMTIFISICLNVSVYSQNVGIGTSSPSEALDVNGAINIGTNSSPGTEAGTIRWNDETQDFEGFTGTEWKSLTREKEFGLRKKVSTESKKITASDATASDGFGQTVSISGDVAIVGARFDDDGASSSGSAYIFVRSGSTWTQAAKLTASDADENDLFGNCVSISGDVAIVGAFNDNEGASNAGAAYIFEKPLSGWVDTTQTAKLTASDAAASDLFGVSVSVSGGVAIVGAYQDDDGGNSTGSAYIYEKPLTGWVDTTESAKLTASDAIGNDNFGESVSISGGVAIVGAKNTDHAGTSSGAAYLFEKPATGWVDTTQTAKLIASDAVAFDFFGFSVAIHGDNVIIGAYQSGAGNAGAAYFFEKPLTGWVDTTQTDKLTATIPTNHFGFSVSISGDYAVVGTHLEDEGAIDSGAAYVFVRSEGIWMELTKLKASDAAEVDFFGKTVSISGDIIIVGSHADDDGGINSGSSYFFECK